jgi:phage protein D
MAEKSTAASYYVKIGDREFEQTSSDGLQQLVIEDHVDMVSMLTLRISGAEGQPKWQFEFGDTVIAKLGKGKTTIFAGEVTSIEPSYQVSGTSSITIRALDHIHRLGRGRKTRFWENRMDSDVVKEVGAECQLSVVADATDGLAPYILQRNESNVAFLKRLAARNNFLLVVDNNALHFKKASFQGSTKKIGMGDNLRDVRMSFNSVDQVQQVVVRGWDIKKKQEIVGTASTGDIEKIGGGELGAVKAACFGESVAYITDIPVSSQTVANAIAKSELERMARQFCRGSATLQGDETIRAGTLVEFSGLSKGFNGKFYVVSSRHVVSDRSGYSTEIRFCSNTMGS